MAKINGKGKTEAKAEAQFWFDTFWQPRELAIWIYELVRRLPNTKLNKSEISDSNRETLLALPPYTKLSGQQKAVLVFIIARVLDSKSINDETSSLYNSTTRSHLPKWQQGQPDKLGDWRQVESMDKPVGTQSVGSNNYDEQTRRWERRRQARERAKIFLPLVLAVWKLMLTTSELKKIIIPSLRNAKEYDLSGVVFSDAELEAALKRAK